MSGKLGQPAVLGKWPVAVVDWGDPLKEVKLRVFASEKGTISDAPDLRREALVLKSAGVDIRGGKCRTVRDVVVKHTLGLFGSKGEIPGRLFEEAEEVGARVAFAYAFRSFNRSGDVDFVSHACKVLGYSKRRNAKHAGMFYGCLDSSNHILLSAVSEAYEDIRPDILGRLGSLPDLGKGGRRGNLTDKLQKVARIVAANEAWQRVPNMERIREITGIHYITLRQTLLEGERIGLIGKEEKKPGREEKRRLKVEFQRGFVEEFRLALTKRVDEIALDGSENKLRAAEDVAYLATAEVVDFLSSGCPRLGATIVGISGLAKLRRKAQALGRTLDLGSDRILGVDVFNVEVTGLPGDDTLFQASKRWAVGHIIRKALKESQGNHAEAARNLGMSQTPLDRRIGRLESAGERIL